MPSKTLHIAFCSHLDLEMAMTVIRSFSVTYARPEAVRDAGSNVVEVDQGQMKRSRFMRAFIPDNVGTISVMKDPGRGLYAMVAWQPGRTIKVGTRGKKQIALFWKHFNLGITKALQETPPVAGSGRGAGGSSRSHGARDYVPSSGDEPKQCCLFFPIAIISILFSLGGFVLLSVGVVEGLIPAVIGIALYLVMKVIRRK